MDFENYKGIFIFVQQIDNKISGVSFELLGRGKELAEDLGTEVTAVLLGFGVGDLVDELAGYGADKVILIDDPALEIYTTEPYAHAMYSVLKNINPKLYFMVQPQLAVILHHVYLQEYIRA
jgi:electron transfer flavoprotein alpha subunit